VTTEETIELLRHFAIFEGVDEASLRSLVEHSQEFEFPQRHVIAREGQLGTGMFLILKGTVNIVRHAVTVDTSGPGEIIGELSLLDRAPRIATLIASDDVVCLGIASWHLDTVLNRPDLAERFKAIEQEHRRAEAARLWTEPNT
jgi:CRP-like cAMP-binding protein